MYLVSELASTVTAYEVTCGCGGLGVKEVFVTNTHGGNGTLPGNYTAAEIHLSTECEPDNRFLLVISRGETTVPDPGGPLITFAVHARTGSLARVQLIGTGGLVPRQFFSINWAGTLVAVGAQGDGHVALVGTGLLAGPAAEVGIESGLGTCLVFDE